MAALAPTKSTTVVNGVHPIQAAAIQQGDLSGRVVHPANGRKDIEDGVNQVAAVKRKVSQENDDAKRVKVENPDEKEDGVKKPTVFKLAKCFAGDDGYITISSFFNKLTKLNMGWIEAGIYSAALSATMGATVNGNPFSSVHFNDAHKLLRENKDAIITPSGINQEALDKLLSYAQPGTDYLSEQDFKKVRDNYQGGDSLVIAAVEQQFKLLMRLCHHYEKIDGAYVQCLSKDVIRQFYNDPETLFKRVESLELPKPMPA